MSTAFEELIIRDTFANRPAAGVPGRLFFDTTNEKWQRDSGSAWQDCVTAGSDPTAIHDDASGEIHAITEKLAPVDADVLLGEDSEDSWSKVRIPISALPSGGGGGGAVPFFLNGLTKPSVSGWTWNNQDSSTITDEGNAVKVLRPSGANERSYCYVGVTAPFRVVYLVNNYTMWTDSGLAVFIRNAGSSQYLAQWRDIGGNGVGYSRYSDFSAGEAGWGWLNGPITRPQFYPYYYGFRVTNTNIYFEMSNVGDNVDANWYTLNTLDVTNLGTYGTSWQTGFEVTSTTSHDGAGLVWHWGVYGS